MGSGSERIVIQELSGSGLVTCFFFFFSLPSSFALYAVYGQYFWGVCAQRSIPLQPV